MVFLLENPYRHPCQGRLASANLFLWELELLCTTNKGIDPYGEALRIFSGKPKYFPVVQTGVEIGKPDTTPAVCFQTPS